MADFIAEAIAVIRQQAQAVGSDENFESVHLAAHLFAVCSYLKEVRSDARMDDFSHARFIASKAEALQRLSTMPATQTAYELYWHALSALVAIDNECTRASDPAEADRRDPFGTAVPLTTTLASIPDGDAVGVSGRVTHWVRPLSRWAELRASRREMATQVMVYPPSPQRQLRYLGMMWQRGEARSAMAVPPGAPPRFRSRRDEHFRLALCPLPGSFGPLFEVSAGGGTFSIDRANAYRNLEGLMSHLDRLIQDVREHHLNWLVLPELMITPELRAHLKQAVNETPGLLGMVAGSYHIWREGAELPWNESAVLDSRGTEIWVHEKRGYFRLTPHQVTILAEASLFRLPLPSLQGQVCEGIERGAHLRFLDTTLGRLVVLICADVLAPDAYQDLLDRVQPDLIFVVAMSEKTAGFEQFATEMEKQGAGTLLVNAATGCGTDEILALAYLGVPEPPHAPPSHLRWRNGHGIEFFDFRSLKKWLPLPSPSRAASLLPEGRGLVIDLAEQWRWQPPEPADLNS